MLHLLFGEAVLDFPCIDEFPALFLAKVHAVELRAIVCNAGDKERVAVPTGHLYPVLITA
jgi:hypothetical protein